MRHDAASFRDGFVRPMLAGRPALVGDPIRPGRRRKLEAQWNRIFDADLAVELGRAAVPYGFGGPMEVDRTDVCAWVFVHDVLGLLHPERHRVWAPAGKWGDVAASCRALWADVAADWRDDPIRLHVPLARLLSARLGGRARRSGRGRRALRAPLAPSGEATDPSTDRSLPAVLEEARRVPGLSDLLAESVHTSPWTALFFPGALGEDRGFPLAAVGRLEERSGWRAVCNAWAAEEDWVGHGGRVMQILARSLDHAEARSADARRGAGWILAALVHVHVLRVWLDDARLTSPGGLGAFHVQHFLALPLAVPRLVRVLGDPLGPGLPALEPRWSRHLERLQKVVMRSVQRDMVAEVVAPVVQRDAP